MYYIKFQFRSNKTNKLKKLKKLIKNNTMLHASTYRRFSGNPYAGEYVHSKLNSSNNDQTGCWSNFNSWINYNIAYPLYKERKIRNTILQYLTSIDIPGLNKELQYHLYGEMFSYIEENSFFLRKNRIFNEALRCRLIDLGQQGWSQAESIYIRLYHNNLPTQRGVFIID